MNTNGAPVDADLVFDSDPEAEYQETVNKSKAQRKAAEDAGLFVKQGNR